MKSCGSGSNLNSRMDLAFQPPFHAQPIKNSSRVPRYQNSLEVVDICDFLVKTPHIGGGLVGSFFAPKKVRSKAKENKFSPFSLRKASNLEKN